MIYYNFVYVLYIVISIYLYLFVLNVFILRKVKKYKNDEYYKATTIENTYNFIILGINYILIIILSVVLAKKYIFNNNFVFNDFYKMFILLTIIVYSNLYFLVAFAYQNTVNIKIEDNKLIKKNIFWDKIIDLSKDTNLKVVINHYIIKKGKIIIAFDRLKYQEEIEDVIYKIEKITHAMFFKLV